MNIGTFHFDGDCLVPIPKSRFVKYFVAICTLVPRGSHKLRYLISFTKYKRRQDYPIGTVKHNSQQNIRYYHFKNSLYPRKSGSLVVLSQFSNTTLKIYVFTDIHVLNKYYLNIIIVIMKTHNPKRTTFTMIISPTIRKQYM